ncbi:MAG: hypothetical protein WD025_00235 [Bacteriovoracaceae bacterium]
MKILLFLIIGALCFSCGKGDKGSNQAVKTPVYRDSPQTSPSLGNVAYKASFKHEHAYLALNKKSPLPSFEDEKYTQALVTRDPSDKVLNYQTYEEGLRTVRIEGLHIVLGGEDSHWSYDLIRKAADVRKLEIFAHTLIIKDAIELAQARVSIRAQKVVFEDNGQIITSPVAKTELPEIQKDGANGLKAGDIHIAAEKIEGADFQPVLIATGGAGQGAGPGVAGARGHNARIVEGRDIHYYVYNKCVDYGRRRGDICEKVKKKGRPAGNGKNAQVGGRPGRGGVGGSIQIISLNDIKVSHSNAGGAHGASDIVRAGGEPGKPVVTCRKEYHKRKGCHRAKKGADARPIVLEGERGEVGEFLFIQGQDFYSEAVAFFYNQYAKDVYLARHQDKAQAAFQELIDYALKIESASPILSAAVVEAKGHLQKINLRLDYFGNTKTWAPKLSFAAAAKLFRKEGASNLKLYFLAKRLNARINELGEERESLKELQDALFENIEDARARITQTVHNSLNLRRGLNNLKVAENEFNFELQKLKEEIKKMAQRNLRVPLWEKAIGAISAASKTIPVGQPSFGAVGAGLDLVAKTLKNKYSANDILRDIPTLSSRFEGFNWKKANAQLNEKLARLDPREFGKFESNEEKLAYLKEIGAFASPMVNAVSEQVKLWKEREVSKSALEQEMQEIRKAHPVYQKVLNKLDKLLVKKQEFIILARGLTQSINADLGGISSNYAAIAYAYGDLVKLGGRFRPEFKKAMTALETRAKNRMEYYAYNLSKAFGYQFLENFPSTLNLSGFYSKAERILARDAGQFETLDHLNTVFLDEVSNLVDWVAKLSTARRELERTLELDPAEVEALNNGEEIFLDLTSLDFFGGNKQNTRLLSVELDESSLYHGHGAGEMRFEHIGSSTVYKDEKVYFFSQEEGSSFKWISSLDSSGLFHSTPSFMNGGGLRSVLDISPGVEVFAMPGARSFIKTGLKAKNANFKNIKVRIKFSFEHKL